MRTTAAFAVFGVVAGIGIRYATHSFVEQRTQNAQTSEASSCGGGLLAVAPAPPQANDKLSDVIRAWHQLGHRAEGDWSSVEEKRFHDEFGGLVVSDLQLIFNVLDDELHVLRDQAFAAVWARGEYQTKLVENGQQAPSGAPRTAIVRRRYLSGPEGMLERQMASLSVTEFSEVYSLQETLGIIGRMAHDLGIPLQTTRRAARNSDRVSGTSY